jgi:hypothetical protein
MTTKPNLLDPRALESAVNDAIRFEGEHSNIVAADSGTITLKREKMTDQVQRLGGSADVLAAFEKQHAADAESILDASKKARWDRLQELNALRERASEAKPHYSPIALATSHGVGSEERGRFLKEYEGLGKAAMQRAADRVKLSGSKVEAAALISVNDKAPRADRGFSSSDLADSIFGEDSRKAFEAFRKIEHAFSNAMARNRQLEGKPMSPTESIAHGLRFPNGPRVTTAPVRLIRNKSALDKLEAGLAAAE